MATLSKPLRNLLEKTVKEARERAEAGAQAALTALAVPYQTFFPHLTSEERELRNRLRAHGRQLGDRLFKTTDQHHKKDEQEIRQLVAECAYEHWHRMLFARFLAENQLLIHPQMGVAVTLEECAELAPDEGAANAWELAGCYAARMLPQIFRPDNRGLQLALAPEHQQELERLLAALPAEVFVAEDSLGWVYQFWQSKRKEEINKSERKIGAEELPAVTQLFTEPYMVQFLLHNSLGAWWAGRRLRAEDFRQAGSEAELREKCGVMGVGWEYLRFVRTSPPGPLSMNGEGEIDSEEIMRAPVTGGVRIDPVKLALARQYRKEPTVQEAQVWEWVRNRRLEGLKFRRQQVIAGFIADFYCAEHRLALEIDGPGHETAAGKAYDEVREEIFAAMGIRTIRVSNNDCTEAYIRQRIRKTLATQPSLPAASESIPLATSQTGESSPFSYSPFKESGSGSKISATSFEEKRSGEATTPSPFMERGWGGEVKEIWQPAAGTFDAWPPTAKELKILDPCCGSGHFLVAASRIMTAFRMQEEGLSAREAGDAVLRDNLFGLEIDERCTQIAAFALAMAAWTYPGAGGYRELPSLNIACSGLAVGARKEEWLKLAGADEPLRQGLERLYDLFKDAPTLGSLIDPEQGLAGDMFQAEWVELQPLLTAALEREEVKKDCFAMEVGIVAQGMSKALQILGTRYHLVTTNVPYLSRVRQSEKLKELCNQYFFNSKNDIATACFDRCMQLLSYGGSMSLVLPQNWLFLSAYKDFRNRTLTSKTWNMLAILGPGAFETISGEVVNVILLLITNFKPHNNHIFWGIDASKSRISTDKAFLIFKGQFKNISQLRQLKNPDSRVALVEGEDIDLLESYADSYWGLGSGDYPRYGRFFWELPRLTDDWIYQLSTVESTILYGGREHILFWEKGDGALVRSPGAFVRGLKVWGTKGILVSQIGKLPITVYTGEAWDTNCAPIIPKDIGNIPAIWAFCSSPDYNEAVRRIDRKLNVTNATLCKIPFDLEYWTKVAAEQYPQGLPAPYSDDPTQWIFHGHPAKSEQPLQVEVARLLGYRWPAELDPEMELADFQREWVKKCEALLPLADNDGIVCLPPVRGERPAAERLLGMLAAAYGPEWSAARLAELLTAAGYAGRTLEAWLRDGFFKEHCQVFHQRPFIWHIWDGRKDGFAALVNYHKLDRKTLETLTYTYLGDWLQRQADGVKQKAAGAEERQTAAQALQDKLKLILAGEEPYDIFVRWKPLEQQPLGWDPDLNDGVRLNIRPFMTADILRHQPKINWNKDRGKDVANAPWYHLFKGERINDHHLSLAEKKNACTAMEKHDA